MQVFIPTYSVWYGYNRNNASIALDHNIEEVVIKIVTNNLQQFRISCYDACSPLGEIDKKEDIVIIQLGTLVHLAIVRSFSHDI